MVGIHCSAGNQHPSAGAPFRCLAALWAAGQFGLEWFSTNAELFGVPFRKGKFQKGDQEGYELLCRMLQQMGSAGWAALPGTVDIDFVMAPGTGGEGPAERLVALSDRMADIFILGQTLTTDVGSSGSKALGEVHAEVKAEALEAAAGFAARMIKQLVSAVIDLNYGETSELPTVKPVIKAVKDQVADANRDKTLFGQLGLPVSLGYLYQRHEVPQPQPGEQLFVPPKVNPFNNLKVPELAGAGNQLSSN